MNHVVVWEHGINMDQSLSCFMRLLLGSIVDFLNVYKWASIQSCAGHVTRVEMVTCAMLFCSDIVVICFCLLVPLP